MTSDCNILVDNKNNNVSCHCFVLTAVSASSGHAKPSDSRVNGLPSPAVSRRTTASDSKRGENLGTLQSIRRLSTYVTEQVYSKAAHTDVSVNDGPHIRR